MKIRSKISLLVIPLSVLPILILGIFSYFSLKEGFNEQTFLDDQQISQLAANQIEQVLDNCRDALIYLSSQISTETPWQREYFFSKKIQNENNSLCELANNIALRYGPHLQIRFIAPDGKELFKTDGLNDGLELKHALEEDIFLQAVAIGDWRFVQTFQLPPRIKADTQTTTFVYRLIEDGHLKGFIFFDLDMKLFSQILTRVARIQGGYFLLFDGRGNSLASGGNMKLLQNVKLKEKFNGRLTVIRQELATTFVHATMKEDNVSYTLGVLPVKEYIAFTEPISEERWYLAVLRSETPLFTAFQRTQRLFMLFLVISFVFAIAGTFFISKKITAPIGKLAFTTREFSQGKLDTKIAIKTNDEIGELANDFNKMVKDLKKMMLEVDIHKNLAAIGKFAAAMYHDVKSPLEGLKLLISGMKKKIKANDPNKKYVDEIYFGINNLDQLIQETMEFVRPKSLSLQPVNLNDILKLVVSNFKMGNIVVHWRLSKTIPNINLDKNQIKHVFLNLINNAVEAMPVGGQLILSSAVKENVIKIEIIDSGMGIKKEDLENIFQPFFSTKKKGHGLGLSLVHQIVSNHNGEIVVESEVGMGTKVIVRLPL